MTLQDLIGKEIKSIETVDEPVTYCYHVDSPEYKNGVTSKKWTQPTSISIKFTDGTSVEIEYDRLGQWFKEEGAIRLSTHVYESGE